MLAQAYGWTPSDLERNRINGTLSVWLSVQDILREIEMPGNRTYFYPANTT
jgi:hypothetical protein